MVELNASYHPYNQVGSFSNLVLDYLNGDSSLRHLYVHSPSKESILQAIHAKSSSHINRDLLVSTFKKQYQTIATSQKVQTNIDALASQKTFTICTAHQPNIFTGKLYFIYKIVHAIKLAEELNASFPHYQFVPVYYMGSEDADLKELGELYLNGHYYQWQTDQQGAVGRMFIDEGFIALLNEIIQQLVSEPFGKELSDKLLLCFQIGKTIQQATFEFVNIFFDSYGLLVLIPDQPEYKNQFKEVIKKELSVGISQTIVEETIKMFPDKYKIQTAGRPINLFYFHEDIRQRIEKTTDGFTVANTTIRFSNDEMLEMAESHPERFSPNVILRPLLQEMILPDVVFIGGGGELAYWMELKSIFGHFSVPFPILLLRNSFCIIDENSAESIHALNLVPEDFFMPIALIHEKYIKEIAKQKIDLYAEKIKLEDVYRSIQTTVSHIDSTLVNHAESLMTKALKKLEALEKKMLRAEKRKSETQLRQIDKIKSILYPNNLLQERVENILPYYASFGDGLFKSLLTISKSFDAQFCIVEIKSAGV